MCPKSTNTDDATVADVKLATEPAAEAPSEPERIWKVQIFLKTNKSPYVFEMTEQQIKDFKFNLYHNERFIDLKGDGRDYTLPIDDIGMVQYI